MRAILTKAGFTYVPFEQVDEHIAKGFRVVALGDELNMVMAPKQYFVTSVPLPTAEIIQFPNSFNRER